MRHTQFFQALFIEGNEGMSVKRIKHPSLEFGREFLVKIPRGFTVDSPSHETYVSWDENLTAENFPQSSLRWGREYACGIYWLHKCMSSFDLLLAGTSNNTHVLGGARGIALISSLDYRENLPRDCHVIGIDTEKNLWDDPCEGLRIPVCSRIGSIGAHLFPWSDGEWRGDAHRPEYCVVYFRDLGPVV